MASSLKDKAKLGVRYFSKSLRSCWQIPFNLLIRYESIIGRRGLGGGIVFDSFLHAERKMLRSKWFYNRISQILLRSPKR
jgi:hypothetical protein